MKPVLGIIIFSLILLAGGCSRKTAPKPASAPNSSSADKGLSPALDPKQARVYLDQGKELYKKDEDQQAADDGDFLFHAHKTFQRGKEIPGVVAGKKEGPSPERPEPSNCTSFG